LTAACEWGGHIEVAKYLINRGADLEGRADRDAFTPLVAAAYQGHTHLIKLLIACGADIHVDHGAPLEWAALFDQPGAVEALLDAGADPDEKSGHDNTALISAASEGPDRRVAVVKALLEAGADVNGRGMSGVTALHEAAASGRLGIVELLLKSGADVNAMDDSGNTPVLRAAEAGHLKVLCLLAERGADLDHSNAHGKTAREILGEMLLSLK
jgi:ankyrin repeat protein